MKLRSLLFLVPLAAAACDSAPEITVDVQVDAAAPAEDPPEVDGVSYGAAAKPTLWSKSLLSVCFYDRTHAFEGMTDADSRELELSTREVVQQAVDGTWGAKTRFAFQWLGTCGPAGADIRIRETEKGVLGYSPYGTGTLIAEMTLNFPCTTGGAGGCSNNGGELCNNGTYISGNIPPADHDHCLRTAAVHEFGHALGLMHEHERPDNTCGLAAGPSNLTPLWDYDPSSRMNYCAPDLFATHTLSAGDLRTISTLYPPQVIAGIPGTGGTVFGPGVYTDGPYNITSLVVSPGLEVKLCSSNNVCSTFTESTEQDKLAAKVIVTARAWGFEHPGYRGRNARFDVGVNTGSKINAACNDCISSMIVPHGLEARVCWHEAAGAGDHCLILGGGPDFDATVYNQLPAEFDNQISFVEVTPKAVLYREKNFTGSGKSFAVNAKISNPLSGATSLLVAKGYHARVCTQVVGGSGAGTCQVLTASGNLDASLDNNVAFLETYPAPIVWEPPPGPGFPPF